MKAPHSLVDRGCLDLDQHIGWPDHRKRELADLDGIRRPGLGNERGSHSCVANGSAQAHAALDALIRVTPVKWRVPLERQDGGP
jgi:hypothetical protein